MKRIIWIELLRITACLGVIMLHVAANNFHDVFPNTFEWQTINFYDGLGRFGVPIFVMISGLLYLEKERDISFKKLYSKYILRILTAYVFWGLVYGFFYSFNESRAINIDLLKNAIITILNNDFHLWYLPMLISLLIITPIIRSVVNSKDGKKLSEYIIILFFIFKVFKYTIFLFGFPYDGYLLKLSNKVVPQLVTSWVGYYVLGHYLYNYGIKKEYLRKTYILGVISIFLGIGINGYQAVIKNLNIFNFYSNFTLFQFFYVVAIFLFFKEIISKIKISDKMEKLIFKVSSCTFGIYLVHIGVLKFLKINVFMFNPVVSVPLITICLFISSYVIVLIIKKIPKISKWIV